MYTHLAPSFRETPEGVDAAAILQKCVHCGFCTATCPTYQLLGDELDGPRGRIYLIKEMLERDTAGPTTQKHLDRCLTCRSCETTCPSGVEYGRLVDIGRMHVERRVARPMLERALRGGLLRFLLSPRFFRAVLGAARAVRRWLPSSLRRRIPVAQRAGVWPARSREHSVILPRGCVQPALLPNVDSSTARVLDRLGVQSLRPLAAACCGALHQHLGHPEDARAMARRNIDAWWPLIGRGAEAIVVNASGCGAQISEYGFLLKDDPVYRDKARRISAATKDLSEYLAGFLSLLQSMANGLPGDVAAVHAPCSLQHGLKLRGSIERVLTAVGVECRTPADAHMCCGSAGTYTILQPELARALGARKAAALAETGAAQFVSANVGCICHLQTHAEQPVRHWIELLDARLTSTSFTELSLS